MTRSVSRRTHADAAPTSARAAQGWLVAALGALGFAAWRRERRNAPAAVEPAPPSTGRVRRADAGAVVAGGFAGDRPRGAGVAYDVAAAPSATVAAAGGSRDGGPVASPPSAAATLSLGTVWTMVKQSVTAWKEDRAPTMGAALAYYATFSMAPLLLIVVSVAGLVFGAEAARGEIFGQIRSLVGDAGAKTIEGLLESVNRPGTGVFGAVGGIVLMLVGATTVFAELQDTLDAIWRAPKREESGVWGLLRARLLSFGLILAIGFLLLVSLVFSAGIAAFQKWWSPSIHGWDVVIQIANAAIAFALVTSMFALIYKLMPRVRIAWADVWIGALATGALFTIGRWLIGLYLSHAAVDSGFGAAGSLVVVLVWMYYSAQIFLLGAEFTWVWAHTIGSKRGETLPPRSDVLPVTQAAATARV